jgi:putative membrane protein
MPYRAWLLVVVLAAIGSSAIAPYDRRDWCLEHLATAATIGFFVWYERRPGGQPLPDVCYSLLAVFTLLHVLGAHFLYSRVPYEAWWHELVGGVPTTGRNHYDRFVHFSFGLLLLPMLAELVHRHVTARRGWTVVVAIAFVGVLSKLYELAEWGIALAVSPEAAEAYNGQQGDPFDAQKDMALAFTGSLVGIPFVAGRRRATAATERRLRERVA